MMTRSAKKKLTPPPKLIPPFHSTAASGTLPIEQTKLKTDTTGPISPFHHEDMRDRGEACRGAQSPPETALGADAHVHGGMTFH